MGDIRIQRGDTTILPNAIGTDTTLAIPLANVSNSFVRLTSTGADYGQVDGATPAFNNQASAVVSIVDVNTIRVLAQVTNATRARIVTWEVWEYLGLPGGPNEFIVRNVGDQLVTVIGGATANPFPVGVARDVFCWRRGMTWEGPLAGVAVAPASGNCVLEMDVAFGTVFLRYVRGVNDANNHPRLHYTAVEYTGSNWTARWNQGANIFFGGVPLAVNLLNGNGGAPLAIPSWSNAIIYAQRRAFSNANSSQGILAWEGPNTAQVRLQYNATSNISVPWNGWYVQVLHHPELLLQANDTITGTGAIHVGAGGALQTITTALTQLADRTRSALFVHGDDSRITISPTGHNWNAVLQDNGGGGDEIKWERANPGLGISDWAYRVADFAQTTDATWNLFAAPLRVLDLTSDPTPATPLRDVHASAWAIDLVQSPAAISLLQTDSFQVQRGETVFGAAAAFVDVTLPQAAALATSFERITNVQGASAGPATVTATDRNDLELGAWVELTGPTTLRVSRQAGAPLEDVVVAWEVVTYTGEADGPNAIATQWRGSLSFGPADTLVAPTWVSLGVTTNPEFTMAIRRGVASDWSTDATPDRRLITLAHSQGAGGPLGSRATAGSNADLYLVAVHFAGSNWTLRETRQLTPGFTVNGFIFDDFPLEALDVAGANGIPDWGEAIALQVSWSWSPLVGTDDYVLAAQNGTTTANVGVAKGAAGVDDPQAMACQVVHNPEMQIQRAIFTQNVLTPVQQDTIAPTPPASTMVAAGMLSNLLARDEPIQAANYRLLDRVTVEQRFTRLGTTLPVLPNEQFHYELATLPETGVSAGWDLEVVADPWIIEPIKEVHGAFQVTVVLDPAEIVVTQSGPATIGFIVQLQDTDIPATVGATAIAAQLAATSCPATVAEATLAVQLAAAALSATVSTATITVQIPRTLTVGTASEVDMAEALSICPIAIDICVSRADSTPFGFTIQDETGTIIDITGFTFLLTVNQEEDPTTITNQIAQLPGTVVPPGSNGFVQFSPAVTDFVDAGDFFFDVQMTTVATTVRTIIKGKFTVRQDITK